MTVSENSGTMSNILIFELENNHTNNTVTEIKNTLEGLNSRISEAEE